MGKVVAWFNHEALHAKPIALGLAYNTLLKAIDPDMSITVTNKPLGTERSVSIQIKGSHGTN